MEIEREASLAAALASGINLFVGAGFSGLASDGDHNALPVGAVLADDLRDRFAIDPDRELDLPRLAAVIATTKREDLRAYLTKRFTVAHFDSRYREIQGLPIHTIFTTNIDDLCFRIYEHSRISYLNDLDANGPTLGDRNAVNYVALHGCVRNDDRPYRFSPTELASSFGADPDRWRYLRRRLSDAPTLLWGYGLADAGTLEALGGWSDLTIREVDRWIVLRPSSGEVERDYFRALGFALIISETDALLDALPSLFSQHSTSAKPAPTGASLGALHDFVVPSVAEIVRRPFEDFVTGSPPTWSEIFSQQLVRTSHYASVAETALSKRHVIIAGIPASGKTTLLMQIAAHLPHNGVRLVLDGPTLARAELIVRALGGSEALICVDNFANDIDAIVLLARATNVTLVAADRDYYLSGVLHRVDLAQEQVPVVSVTALSEADRQLLRDSIPAALRRRSDGSTLDMAANTKPSLFELIQSSVRGPSLAKRFRLALRELQTKNPRRAELLLLIAYVHSCRTPVSLDMVIGYLSDNEAQINYAEVSDELRTIGELLQEYPDELTDGVQDYFTTRSALAGETILEAASASDLGSMLARFHENLSSVRITNYAIFRRRAFAAHLFAKAFPTWTDGTAIYDLVYGRDPSPYTLQQKAQYLSHVGEHRLAFEVIEEAVARTSSTNWTIRNAQAQILFKANIHMSGVPGAREQLERAMETLSQCLTADRRKSVHAMVFGDFALQFSAVFRDGTGSRYLDQAYGWLQQTQLQEPWLARVNRLLPLVDARRRELPAG
jgi:energy-coupling factor transporter ATP-binding protein EcfA2